MPLIFAGLAAASNNLELPQIYRLVDWWGLLTERVLGHMHAVVWSVCVVVGVCVCGRGGGVQHSQPELRVYGIWVQGGRQLYSVGFAPTIVFMPLIVAGLAAASNNLELPQVYRLVESGVGGVCWGGGLDGTCLFVSVWTRGGGRCVCRVC